MIADRSAGWDEIVDRFIAVRSAAGASLVRSWAKASLPRGASVLDLGCGTGEPITRALLEAECNPFAADASPAMIAAFRERFPDVPAVCEAAEDGAYFDRSFDAVVAVGLLFLLSETGQQCVIGRVASALKPGGKFLFSAPLQRCTWRDTLTGRTSRSLGQQRYAALLREAGLEMLGHRSDEGENSYIEAMKQG